MYKNRQKHLTGWRAGWAGTRTRLTLSGFTATQPGRKLEGPELEAAKRRLLERYGIRDQPEPPDTRPQG